MSSIPSIQIPDRSAASAPGSLDRVIRGRDDLWGQIAHALNTDVGAVYLESCRLNPYGNVLRCKGHADGKSFYAKVYLTPRHPVPPRFIPPWADWSHENGIFRQVSEQIRKEWETTNRLRTLPGFSQIPIPLGMSGAAKTIVWELAGGMRLDSIAKRSWLTDRKGENVGVALSQAGKWLRKLHDSTVSGRASVDVRNAIRNLEMRMPGKRIAEQLYIQTAIELLKDFVAKAGGSIFPFPLVLSHGDFCMANLIWDVPGKRLTVVDFELTEARTSACDLFALVSDLRSRLLVPWIPKATVLFWEKSFWEGYGKVATEIRGLVDTLALARVYYHHLPRLLTRRMRRGRLAGFAASTYRTFVEPWIISQRLDNQF